MVDGLLSDELAGISEPRKVQDREKSNLEKLVEAEATVIHAETNGWLKDVSVEFGRFLGGYQFIYERLVELLNDVNFTEKDLGEFVLAKANSDYQPDYSAALGLFTGCLLQILTERNAKEDKRTIVYINGMGNRFDYLFSHAVAVDTLIVDNFMGDYICHRIGGLDDKKARTIGVLNTSGNKICAGANSRVWNLFIVDCYGDYIALGDYTASEILENLSNDSEKALASNIYIINVEGNYTADNIASNGRISNVFIVNESGNVNVGNLNARNSRINTLYIISLGGIISFTRSDELVQDILDSITNQSLIPTTTQELYMYDSSVYTDRGALTKFQIKMQENSADEKINILKALKGKSYNNVMETLKLHF